MSLTKHQPTSFEMLANAAAWQRLPEDLQEILARNFDEAALLERADIDAGDQTLQAELEKQGMSFTTPDRASFRAVIQENGLYETWRDTYGKEPFALLEAAVGKLT